MAEGTSQASRGTGDREKQGVLAKAVGRVRSLAVPLLDLSPSGELLPGPRDQASRGDHFGHKGWDGLRLEPLVVHLDPARVGVYPDLYPRLGRACHARVGY